ncbi:DMT family transporter [Clostridium tetani]|nr:DMT family transporter [Clostridium tetani]
MKDVKKAHFLAIILMILWGMSYLSIKVVVHEIHPVLSAFYRFLIAAIILFIYLKVRYPEEKVLKEDKIKMALGGFFGVAMYFLFENYAVYFTTASNVAIIISSIPIFTLISQRIIFKEKINVVKAIGASLSIIGIGIILLSKGKVSLFSKGTIGDLMGIGAALCWVAYTVVISKLKGNYRSIVITTYQTIWGCIFLSPSIFIFQHSMPSTKAIANLLYLSFFCTCIGYAIYIYCQNKLGATVITTYINLQPIVSIISAKILLNENINSKQILGSAIIIIGLFLASKSEKINKQVIEALKG